MNGDPLADRSCPIDHEHLTDMSAGDIEFEAELMQEFLRVTPPLLTELEASIRAEDFPVLERVAHTVKGSCRSLGAKPLSNPCETLEKMARAEKLEDTNELLEEIRTLYTNLSDYIAATWDVRAA